MVQCGFAPPANFFVSFSEAVLRVHRSGHRILSPHPYAVGRISSNCRTKGSEDRYLDEPLTVTLPFSAVREYLIWDLPSSSSLCRFFFLNSVKSLTQFLIHCFLWLFTSMLGCFDSVQSCKEMCACISALSHCTVCQHKLQYYIKLLPACWKCSLDAQWVW